MYEFTFDLTGAKSEYGKIKDYMIANGFDWLKDSDYITSEPVTVMEMETIENNIKHQFSWLLQMSTKIYDASQVP